MKSSKENGTLNNQVFETIREEVLRGKHQPAQRLRVATLAAAHGVSLNVIREALNRLVGQGLVHAEPQIGFTVPGLSAGDLEDLVSMRLLMESRALRECIARSTVEWQSQVLAAHHRLHRTPITLLSDPTALNPQWISRHDEFHHVLLEGCGSPRLFQVICQLADAAAVYHRALLPVVDRDEEMDAEHRILLDAVLASDANRAVAVLEQHLGKTRDVMLPLLQAREARALALPSAA